MPDNNISLRDAAVRLGVSHQTIQRMIDNGVIEGAHRTPGGHRRIPQPALDAYIAKQATAQAALADPGNAVKAVELFCLQHPHFDLARSAPAGPFTNPHTAALFAAWAGGYAAGVAGCKEA